MSVLFNGENSDSDGELKINAEYAGIYDNFRQKEELHKLKARYGEDATFSEDESSDSDSSEDENVHDPEFDKQFLISLAYLKSGNLSTYDEKITSSNDIDKPGTSESIKVEEKEKKKSKKEKLFSLRDYERKIILERDGRFSSSEDEDDTRQKVKSKTYVEEQKELRDSFRHALKDEDNEDNDLLKIKQKTEEEKHKEEESYKEWLKGQEVEIDSKDKEMLKPLRDFWSDPNLDVNEKFLRDYILNNKYMDKDFYDGDLDYNHVIHDSDENLSEDEKTIQKQEEFEHKYNFRFEEPDQEFIKKYPRTMENSMRKKDTRRAQKRAEVRQRKEEEKQQKREELKQFKALKRKEIEEKIEKLKEITGNDDMRFDNVNFDSDFDPNEHDRKMKEIFNDEYYAGGEDEMQKPEFPEIDEELDIEPTWDTYDPTKNKIDMENTPYEEPHCEDPDFNMDADYDESRNLQSELIDNTKKKKRRRRSKFAELIAKEKPKFDPKQFPSYADYFDQYYSLDYEDIIGGLPCRFKYRKVMPNDYGLSVEEILVADDRELNKWCPLRQALKYKPEHAEKNEIRIYKEKSINEGHKRKILKSLYTESDEREEKDELITEETKTSDKKRKRRKKSKANNPNVESTNTDTVSKEKSIHITENCVQNNLHNNDDTKEDERNKSMQEENIINKSKKRKDKLETDGDDPVSKKRKTDNTAKEDFQIKADTNNIKVKNNNEKAINKSAGQKKKKNRSSKFNQINTRKHKSDYDDPTISLNAERLKTYGINAKKLKNKLKYGNKKL